MFVYYVQYQYWFVYEWILNSNVEYGSTEITVDRISELYISRSIIWNIKFIFLAILFIMRCILDMKMYIFPKKKKKKKIYGKQTI